MERLTDKKEADAQRKEYEIRIKQGYPRNIPEERFLRLAAYEDTGLEPDEIKQVFDEWHHYLKFAGEKNAIEGALDDLYADGKVDYSRLRELAKADREGRVVVLPCKREDTLWTFHTYPSTRIYSVKVTDISTRNGRTMLKTDHMGVVDARDVGNTVFLTRESAKEALKARKGGKHETTD